jgi:hypothetical protein
LDGSESYGIEKGPLRVTFECAGRPAESRWCKSTTMKE